MLNLTIKLYNIIYLKKHMNTTSLTSILSLQCLFFYRTQLKCVNPLKHRDICRYNKRSIV